MDPKGGRYEGHRASVPHRRKERAVVVAVVLSFITAIALNFIVPKGFGIGFIFLIPLVVSSYLKRPRVTLAVALLSLPAISLGFFISPPGYDEASIFNRATSILIVLVTTYFVLIRINDERAIAEYAKRAEEGRRYLQNVIDTVPIPLIVYDAGGNVKITNPPAEELWSGRPPQPGGQVEGVIRRSEGCEEVLPDDYAISRILRGLTVRDEQVDVTFDRGPHRTLLVFGAPIADSEGGVSGGAVAYMDVTELISLKNELQRSNEELQQFAYVASHDLQEPLRMVINYLTLLNKRYEGQLDQKAQSYIAYAVEGGERMRALIMDLLAYSRIGTRGKPLVPVDMGSVVTVALSHLEVPITEADAQVLVDPLPTVPADESQMVQVMQNLIANAIKFRGPERPVVRISVRPEAKGWTFAVKDNGIGIPKDQQDRLFQMFQRLHTSEEYEGTGIGLALCKKIVERHGGRIWVESEEGKGATFYFTLPR